MCVVALFCMCGLSVGLCVVCGVSVGLMFCVWCQCGGLCFVCGVSVGAYVLCVVSVWGLMFCVWCQCGGLCFVCGVSVYLMCVARHALECGVCEMYVNKTWLLYKYIQPFPPWYSDWTNSH